MIPSILQISAQFYWSGNGAGPVTAGSATPGNSKPTSAIIDTGYEIIDTDPANAAYRENGKGNWDPAGSGTLTRTEIHFNGLTGLRSPAAGAVSFLPGTTKVVTLMSLPDDFGSLAGLSQVGTAQVADDAVTLAKVAHGTANRLTGYDAAGAPAEVAAGSGIVISAGTITATAAGGGEANVGANVPTHGVGVYDGKVGLTLNFRGIASLSPALTVALDDTQNDIDLTLVFANQAEAEAGVEATKLMTAQRVAQAIAATGGGGAPVNASYLTLAAVTALTGERILTPEHSLAGADDGANGPYRISLLNDAATPGPSRVYGTTGLGVKGWKPSPDLSFHTVAPIATDDGPAGYVEGHIWIDTVAQNGYLSVNDADNAAVWDLIGGTGGSVTIATEAEARAGTNNTAAMTPLRTEQHHESRAAKTGAFNPGAVLVDDNWQFTTYVQTGALSFVKAGAGTFRPGKVLQVTFESTGATLSWSSDFERIDITGSLPTSLPAGLHTLFFGWNSDRNRVQVSIPTIVAEEINGTLSDIVLKKYDETLAVQAGVTGALTINRANAVVHQVTHGAGNITSTTISGWPVSGVFGTVTLDLVQDGVGGRTWTAPAGFVWAGATPTFVTTTGKTNRVTLTTKTGGATGVMHYGNSW